MQSMQLRGWVSAISFCRVLHSTGACRDLTYLELQELLPVRGKIYFVPHCDDRFVGQSLDGFSMACELVKLIRGMNDAVES